MAGVHTSCYPTPTKPDYNLLLNIFPELFFTGGLVLHKTDILYPEAQPKGRIAHCMFICRRGYTTHT